MGKSCIVLNFTEQKPRKQHQVTVACEFASGTVQTNGKAVKVQIWDTAGQENFRSITRSYYRSSIAAIVVYDITSYIRKHPGGKIILEGVGKDATNLFSRLAS